MDHHEVIPDAKGVHAKDDGQVNPRVPPAVSCVSVPRHALFTHDGKLLGCGNKLVGASISIGDPKGQDRALSLVGSVEWIQASAVNTMHRYSG